MLLGILGEIRRLVLAVVPHARRRTGPFVLPALVVGSRSPDFEYFVYLRRDYITISHAGPRREWARDDDGDGVREAHINTTEGHRTGLRTFLRPFRGLSEWYGIWTSTSRSTNGATASSG